MAKKKVIVERKPTPAKFLLPMEYLDSMLRKSTGFHNIAVRLPASKNNAKWIKENFPFGKKLQDIVKPIEGPLIAANVYNGVTPRTFNSKNVRYCHNNRYIVNFKARAVDLQFQYELQAQEGDIIWWFYSEQSEQPTTLVRNFYNHMYYDESIRPAFIVDKWSDSHQSFVDNYIPLASVSQND